MRFLRRLIATRSGPFLGAVFLCTHFVRTFRLVPCADSSLASFAAASIFLTYFLSVGKLAFQPLLPPGPTSYVSACYLPVPRYPGRNILRHWAWHTLSGEPFLPCALPKIPA